MSWPAATLALLISHMVGDFLFQTEWQAVNKGAGLGEAVARRALLRHVFTYTLAFVPALVWIAAEVNVLRAVAVGLLVAVPHVLLDDGSVVRWWLQDVKHSQDPPAGLSIVVDQSFHVVCLLGAALVAAA